MSYILEAIRRSEAQRENKSDQKPVRLRHSPPQKQSLSGRWLFVALAALAAINIATLAYVAQRGAGGGKSVKGTGAPTRAVEQRAVASETESVTTPVISPKMGSKKPDPKSAEGGVAKAKTVLASRNAHPKAQARATRTASLPSANASSPSFARETGKRASSPRSETASDKTVTPPLPRVLDAPEKTIRPIINPSAASAVIPGNAGGSPAVQKIPSFNELPGELRQRIPAIKVNVHAYSEAPEEQFIIVDMIKYRSGERIAEGLMLEQVTPQGVVLRFEGTAFRLSKP